VDELEAAAAFVAEVVRVIERVGDLDQDLERDRQRDRAGAVARHREDDVRAGHLGRRLVAAKRRRLGE
jgi:hypothetical protein